LSALDIKDLSMRFDLPNGTWVQALKDINLSIAEGEILSVLGPSGCGKTTLLNIVAGFLAPTSGRVEIGGTHVMGPGPERAWCFRKARFSNG
jgi:taurine transport system ATP-binding protein